MEEDAGLELECLGGSRMEQKKNLALEIIERLKHEYPDSECSLDYNEAWKLLVSVRLAAQCTDARVNVVVEKLYEKYKEKDFVVIGFPANNFMCSTRARCRHWQTNASSSGTTTGQCPACCWSGRCAWPGAGTGCLL